MGLLSRFKYPVEVDIFSVRGDTFEPRSDWAKRIKTKDGREWYKLKKSKNKIAPQSFDNIWFFRNTKKKKLYLLEIGSGVYVPMKPSFFHDLKQEDAKMLRANLVAQAEELKSNIPFILRQVQRAKERYSEPTFFERYGAYITAILVVVVSSIIFWIAAKNLGGVAKALGDVAKNLRHGAMIPLWYIPKINSKKMKKMSFSISSKQSGE